MPFKKGIPEGMRSLSPHIYCRGAAKALDFYKKAFGAVEISRSPVPGNESKLMHSLIMIGDSSMMVVDEFPEHGAKAPPTVGGTPVTLHLYVENADATFKAAVEAGAKATMPMMDMFWGDRYGQIEDPFGHKWSIATRVRDVPPDELAKAGAAAMANMKRPGGK